MSTEYSSMVVSAATATAMIVQGVVHSKAYHSRFHGLSMANSHASSPHSQRSSRTISQMDVICPSVSAMFVCLCLSLSSYQSRWRLRLLAGQMTNCHNIDAMASALHSLREVSRLFLVTTNAVCEYVASSGQHIAKCSTFHLFIATKGNCSTISGPESTALLCRICKHYRGPSNLSPIRKAIYYCSSWQCLAPMECASFSFH